jgi:PAS domain-containing protein
MTAALDDQIAELRRTNAELHQRLGEALGREAVTATALRANEERHALATQAVAEGIYDWDIDTNALWVSPRLIEIFGLAGESLSAADWNERIQPDDFEHYRTELRECFRGVTARLNIANTAFVTGTADIAGSRIAACRCVTRRAERSAS